jgi:F-type H+-transporting ATPase subunit delta
MSYRTLGKRYAGALLSIAMEQGKVSEVEAELNALRDVYEANADLRTFLEHPMKSVSDKSTLFRNVFSGKLSDLLMDFVDLLIRRGRIVALPDVAHVFDDMADAHQGVVRAEARSFLPLNEQEQARLVEQVQKLYPGSDVDLQVEVDESLLGGVELRIGDQVIDGTVAGRLKKVREYLLTRKVTA